MEFRVTVFVFKVVLGEVGQTDSARRTVPLSLSIFAYEPTYV